MKIAGIDLAWRGESNPSAIAAGSCSRNRVILEDIEPAIIGFNAVFDYILGIDNLKGVAVDASLIISNQKGQRACETELGRVYGSRGASCHASNLKLYPDAFSVRLSEKLAAEGFHHLGPEKWQIECYPHPSIIEFFALQKRLKYKKGKVAEKKEGQQKLASYLLQLSDSPVLKLVIPEAFKHIFRAEYIRTLKGKALKSNEDALDAVVCLYIAASYASKTAHVIFGNTEEGYIWVPKGKRI